MQFTHAITGTTKSNVTDNFLRRVVVIVIAKSGKINVYDKKCNEITCNEGIMKFYALINVRVYYVSNFVNLSIVLVLLLSCSLLLNIFLDFCHAQNQVFSILY